ncbi:TonB-dependent receptor plug domain-containing protein [Marinibaculum pumilum]|uniref:TonB-dependent receptor plug domain-containing protein n=1 Tax=Marinibaculum pumilum TaxID=1766165 RepID=A0ABV7L7V1_9PROT
MTRQICLSAAGILLAGIAASTAIAQEAGRPLRLEPVVVTTPNLTPTPINEVGSAVSVLTAEELEDRQTSRLQDALNTLPGVDVSPNGATGAATPVRIRGLGPRNTLVIVDGIEVADPSRAQVVYEFGTMPVDSIRSVEVLRGPQSALYGADASGGVINIVTKDPTKPFQASGLAEAGSYGEIRTNAGVGGVQGPVTFSADAATFRTRGYSSFSDKRGGSEADDFHSKSLQGKAKVAIGDNVTAFAKGRWVWERQPSDSATRDLIDTYIKKQEQYYRAGSDISLLDGRLTTTIAANYSWHHRTYIRGTLNGDTYDGTKTKLEARSAYAVSDRVTLAGGVETEEQQLRQRAPNSAGTPALGSIDATVGTNSAFGEAQVEPWRNLTLTVGGRYDDNQQFGGEFTWRGTAAWFLPDWIAPGWGTKFRGSYGTGFVTPSLYELNDPCIGFSDLKPEKSKGFDFGIDQSLPQGRLDLSATLFRVDIRDQIAYDSFRTLPAACQPYFGTTGGYGNRDTVRSDGVEFAVAAEPVDRFVVRGSYTYDRANDTSTDTSLADVPAHKAYLDLSYGVTDALRVGGSARYQSSQRNFVGWSDPFTVFGLRADYDLRPNVSLFGRVENVLNHQYEERAGIGTPDRSVYAGIRARF